MNSKDKEIVRELAARYMEAACSEEQKKMNERFKATNDLKIVRPPVLIDEIPWHQMDIDGELKCLSEDKNVRRVELELRKRLYRVKYFKADRLFDPFWRLVISTKDTGMGVDYNETEIIYSEGKGTIASHTYEDVLEDESVLEKMHVPEFFVDHEKTDRDMEFMTELLGDAMPVKKVGFQYIYSMPWDRITRYRGVEPIMFDMYDRPEYLHKIIKLFTDAVKAQLDFAEENLPITPDLINMHCTPAAVSGLAESGLKATWYRGGAQSFGVVSPEMFKEFELDYIKPLAERFAYTYYGCCEPLDNKIQMLKEIPNLRKLGVSPWADVNVCGEQIGGDYVFARKPNPALVAIKTDPDEVRKETVKAVEACMRYGCPAEFVLKDISTVTHRPENLIVWASTVSDVLDEYYGKA